MSNDTSDNEDIQRQIRSLYVSGNILRRKFHYCSVYIKFYLGCSKAIAPVCIAQVCGAVSQNLFSVV